MLRGIHESLIDSGSIMMKWRGLFHLLRYLRTLSSALVIKEIDVLDLVIIVLSFNILRI